MTTFRNKPRRDFTILRNQMLRDPNLSLKAKGLLALMLSFPDNWTYRQKHLMSLNTDGEAATRGALKELRAAGYLHQERERRPDGTLGESIYLVSDEVSTYTRFSSPGSSSPGQPGTTNTDINEEQGDEVKPLSASADSAPSRPKASAKSKASPSATTPPVPRDPPFDFQMTLLMVEYNTWRKSGKGELVEARGRSKARDAAARAFLKDMKRNGYDPFKCLEVVTRHLANDDYYLGKLDGPRRGFETVLRNWHKYYEAALENYRTFDLPAHKVVRMYLGNKRTAARILGDGTRGKVKVVEVQRDHPGQAFRVVGEPIEVERSWLRPGEILE